MTNVDDRKATADRAVAAALAASAAASAAVPETDLAPVTGGKVAETGATLAWRWIVGTDALDLHAVHADSPHWRATSVGAGGALHRARVALAAEGLAARVTLLPSAPARWEAGSPDTSHLARLVVAGTIEVTDEARALYAATDPEDGGVDGGRGALALRRGASARALVRELVGAARAEGVRLRLIRDGDELIGLLHGHDTREAWLRAGMAASAVRLLARRHGLATVAVLATDHRGAAPPRRGSSLAGTAPARTGWRRIGDREGWLSVGIGTPYLRLRLSPLSS